MNNIWDTDIEQRIERHVNYREDSLFEARTEMLSETGSSRYLKTVGRNIATYVFQTQELAEEFIAEEKAHVNTPDGTTFAVKSDVHVTDGEVFRVQVVKPISRPREATLTDIYDLLYEKFVSPPLVPTGLVPVDDVY